MMVENGLVVIHKKRDIYTIYIIYLYLFIYYRFMVFNLYLFIYIYIRFYMFTCLTYVFNMVWYGSIVYIYD